LLSCRWSSNNCLRIIPRRLQPQPFLKKVQTCHFRQTGAGLPFSPLTRCWRIATVYSYIIPCSCPCGYALYGMGSFDCVESTFAMTHVVTIIIRTIFITESSILSLPMDLKQYAVYFGAYSTNPLMRLSIRSNLSQMSAVTILSHCSLFRPFEEEKKNFCSFLL